ncbi:MAG TPA: ankyrin repeat domain-containing protein [Gaiellales bacterium]|jgi:ankyrin repeat protein
MIEAAEAGDVAGVERLIGESPDLAAARGPDGVSAILRARYHGHAWIAERLADTVSELDMYEAAALGRAARVADVVSADPDAVRAEAADGFTALHLAAYFGQLEVAAVLLEHGAAVDAQAGNPTRVQPLHSAAAGGHAAIAALLLERGADPDARQQGGFAPLHSAAARGDVVTARLLLDHGATRDIRADDDRRPIDLVPAADGIRDLLGG